MIRISGGKFRSRLLLTPSTNKTKPTMDRVREGVFSALGFDVTNKNILDLYAGSGSYGFEALSRGAKCATFVDSSDLAISSIKENARTLGVMNQAKVLFMDSSNFIVNSKDKFDIVFIDPPYKECDYELLIDNLLKSNILNNHSIIVVESDRDLEFDVSNFAKIKKYKYSCTKIYILRK